MAHMLGIKKENAHAIIGHIARSRKTGENVDQELSRFNEYKTKDSNKDLYTIYKEEIAKCKVQNRKDVNVLASWVITLPKDIEPGSKEEKIFFDTTRDFLKERYPDTYLGDSIHRDEPKSRPHMHYLLIPKVKEIKVEKIRDPKTGKLKKTGRKIETGRYKIALNDLIKRADLIRFHDDLNDRMKQVLGREVQILTGTTAENGGNMNLNQYRAEMERRNALKAQAEAAKKEAAADSALKTVREAESQIKRNVAKAEADRKEAEVQKTEAQKKIDYLTQQEIDLRQRLIKVEAADARLKTKEKSLEKREKAIQEREIAIEETRPDLRAQRLKEEISKLSEKLSAPELKPIKKEEMAEIARGEAEPRYKELYAALKRLEKAYKRGSGDMAQIANDLRITKSKMEHININIGNDPAKCAKAEAKYRELQENEAEKEQLRQALSQKLNTKKIEFEYNSSGAALWLIENASKWPQIAKIINEQREKESEIVQKQPERQLERQSEVRIKPKTRNSFER